MVSPSTPAVVIAAPASGSGKTTVATGLIGALRRSGSSVAPFKVGPDYIDPGYHGLAAGRPGRNLDTVLVGPDRIGPLYRHGTAGCDIAVVEGVMGLFDGKIDEANSQPSAEGSTAQVASILGSPVVLVIDARGHSQSLAAVLHGFATYDAGVRIGGVILNRVGSARHEQVLRHAWRQGRRRSARSCATVDGTRSSLPAPRPDSGGRARRRRCGRSGRDVRLDCLARRSGCCSRIGRLERECSLHGIRLPRSAHTQSLGLWLRWRVARPSPSATPSTGSC